MATYDPKDVQITIGGVSIDGLTEAGYEDESPTVVVDSSGRVRGTVVTGRRRGASAGDDVQRVREMIEGPCQRSMDDGVAQVVDVTGLFSGWRPIDALVSVQRAIDAVTHGTAASGYAVVAVDRLAVVFRGVAPPGDRSP